MTVFGVSELLLMASFGELHKCYGRATPREKLALCTLTPGATLVDSLGHSLPLPPDHSHTPPLPAIGSGCKVVL